MILDPTARRSRKAGLRPQRAPGGALGRVRRHHPDFDKLNTQGWKALEAEGKLSEQGWRKEQQWALDMGLPGADSLTDRSIPTFARGELPHFAGINTFLKAPYVENIHDVGKYDAAVIGIRSTPRPPPFCALRPRCFGIVSATPQFAGARSATIRCIARCASAPPTLRPPSTALGCAGLASRPRVEGLARPRSGSQQPATVPRA